MAGLSNRPQSPRQTAAREREQMAFDLRKSGASYAAIGSRLGISPQAAYKCVSRVLKRIVADTKDNVEAVRQIEVERIDRLTMAIWQGATSGNLGAIDRVLKLSERRAKLLGLDAPQTIDLTRKDNPRELTDDELAAIIASENNQSNSGG